MNAVKEKYYKNELEAVIKLLSSKSKRLAPKYSKIDEIFDYYERYRAGIHKYMVSEFPDQEKLMDRHKIAAAFFCSFLKSRPIGYVPDNSGKDPLFCELRANEQGAFLFGLQIVQDFIADRAKDNLYSADDQEIYKKLIHIPGTKTDSYIHWFVKLIVDGVEKCFDIDNEKYEEKLIFFIAHIYFMLEEQSYQYHKIELLESRINRLRSELAAEQKKNS